MCILYLHINSYSLILFVFSLTLVIVIHHLFDIKVCLTKP